MHFSKAFEAEWLERCLLHPKKHESFQVGLGFHKGVACSGWMSVCIMSNDLIVTPLTLIVSLFTLPASPQQRQSVDSRSMDEVWAAMEPGELPWHVNERTMKQ